MLKPGMFIAERYEIIDTVGSGGMADVYKARCHKLNRYVAIKVLKEEFSSDESFVDKFRAEAQSAAGLQHPNIVNIYDVGEENGMYYIVMELIEGITLKSFIERKGRLEVREATGIAIQIAQGLEAAHDNNIIHRDIKPQNIIISRDGKVKVADFGIAKAASSNTLTSSAMGSVHYISPEQARGGYSDEKSDIYSLGITMYEMILGKVPFEGDNAVSIALLHIQEEIMPLGELIGDIPISTDKIVLKCLQKKPERRYLSVVELIADLKRSLVEPGVDFVVIPDVLNNSPTIALSANDVNAIRSGAMQGLNAEIASMNEQMNQGPMGGMNQGHMQGMNDQMNQGNMNGMQQGRNYNNDMNYGNNGAFPGNNQNGYNDDFVDPDEEVVDDKLEKITKIGAVVIIVFIIGIIVYLLSSGGNDRKEPETPVQSEVPAISASFPADSMPEVLEVEGKLIDEAEEILKGQGFTVSKREIAPPSPEYDGIVKEQQPAPGTPWPLNTPVTLIVYKVGAKEEEEMREETKKMVDMVGMTPTEVMDALDDLFDKHSLNIVYKQENHDTIPVNSVTRTKPAAGEKIKNTDKLTIYLSIGQNDSVVVPKLVRCSSVEEARRKLEEVGLKLGNIKEVSYRNYNNGEVVGQSHPAGSSIDKGASIDIDVNVITQTEAPTEIPTIAPTPTEQAREQEYTVIVMVEIDSSDLFKEDAGDDSQVSANAKFVYDGTEYDDTKSVRKGSYEGNIELRYTVKTKNDLRDGDIKASDIVINFRDAKDGAKDKASIAGINVLR